MRVMVGLKTTLAVWPPIELELRFQNECGVCHETTSLVSKYKVLGQLLIAYVRQIIQNIATNLRFYFKKVLPALIIKHI